MCKSVLSVLREVFTDISRLGAAVVPGGGDNGSFPISVGKRFNNVLSFVCSFCAATRKETVRRNRMMNSFFISRYVLTEVSVDDKFLSDTSDIDNADTFVLGKFMS